MVSNLFVTHKHVRKRLKQKVNGSVVNKLNTSRSSRLYLYFHPWYQLSCKALNWSTKHRMNLLIDWVKRPKNSDRPQQSRATAENLTWMWAYCSGTRRWWCWTTWWVSWCRRFRRCCCNVGSCTKIHKMSQQIKLFVITGKSRPYRSQQSRAIAENLTLRWTYCSGSSRWWCDGWTTW